MNRSRILDASRDFCCLPSPHRLPRSVAGMAFNFSKVCLDPPQGKRPAAVPQPAPQRSQTNAGRALAPLSCFGLPYFSPAT